MPARNEVTAIRHKMLRWSGARTAYAVIFAGGVVLMELGARYYRPWVADQNIRDFGIADTLGNHVGTMAQIFAILTLIHATREEARLTVGLVTAGYCLYELAWVWLPGSKADLKDVLATVVGGLVAFALVLLVERWSEPPE